MSRVDGFTLRDKNGKEKGKIVEVSVDRPLCQFRVFPNKFSRLFMYVKIFPSCKDMYRYVKQTHWYGGKEHKNYDALCRTWRRSTEGRLSPEMGDMLFYRDRLQADAVAHECMHATFEFMHRVRLKMPNRSKEETKRAGDEEIVCHSVGDMSSQVYRGLRKHGIID